MVKVRVHFKRYEDVWHEYELPVAVPPRAGSPAPVRDAEPVYDVVLVQARVLNWLRITGELAEMLPHLDDAQVGDLLTSAPIGVMENVDRHAAEVARARLEAAGAMVEVRRGPEVVERMPAYALPIPHQGPSGETGALPVPASQDQAARLSNGAGDGAGAEPIR